MTAPPTTGNDRQDEPRSHIAVYAGSFDPITLGHLDVLRRARRLFDGLILGIGHNPDKPAMFDFAERVEMAQSLIDEMLREQVPGVRSQVSGTAEQSREPHDPDTCHLTPDTSLAPVRVESYSGLTVDFARSKGACAIVRGIRNITDLASETQLAIANRQVADIETVFIVTGEAYAFTSSSLIRQIAGLGGDLNRLSNIIPPIVIERLRAMRRDPKNPLSRLAHDALVE
jgi:pantetheine-phosphate adenylyltransferase